MAGINIRQDDQWNFNFDSPYTGYWLLPRHHCHYCGIGINRTYSYIIDSLKEAGYLDEDYKEICCYCKVLEKFGLLHVRDDLQRLFYIKEKDIMVVYFSFDNMYNSESKNYVVRTDYDVRIHNYSKWF